MNTQQDLKQTFGLFKDLLINQIKSLEAAETYLNEIKNSIQSNDLETLQNLIKHNGIPLSQIEQLEGERFSLTFNCGFEKNKDGFIQCINACDDSDKTLQQLQIKLYQTMDNLKKATKVNDLLVVNNKKRIQQSLHILTGMTLNKDQTYSDKGTKLQGGRTRPLATA